MDSKVVTKEINRLVRPVLANRGFDRRVGRSFFRDVGDSIDIVHFQSFNSYIASGVGCTTYSFGVSLGTWFASFPTQHALKRDGKGRLTPGPIQCPLRYTLAKGIEQPFFHPNRDVGSAQVLDRIDTWYVLEDGTNVISCLDDVVKQLDEQADAWFAWAHDADALLAYYKNAALRVFRRMPKPVGPDIQSEPTYRNGVEVAGDVGRFDIANPYLMGAWAGIEARDIPFARDCLRRLEEEFPTLEPERLLLESRI